VALGNDVSDLKSALTKLDESTSYILEEVFELSKNLANPDNWINGRVIDANNGGLNSNSDYKTMDYMPCIPSDVLYFTGITQAGAFRGINTISPFRIGFYDKDKTFISAVNASNSVTVPANAVFFRFTTQTANTSTWCASANWYPTSVADFVYYTAPQYTLPDLVSDIKEDVDQNFENIDTVLGYTVSRNLADKTKVTAGAVIDRNTGELNTNADYQTSAFIPCSSGNIVYFTSLSSRGVFSNISTVSFFRIGFYKEDYTYISCENYANGVTVPADSAFFRFS
jgi:hypothetical protein